MKTNIRWSAVRSQLDRTEWEPTVENPNEMEQRSIYIGTIQNWTPTGKVYAPWTTNVTEKEAGLDQQWWDAANAEAEANGVSIETGEGDGCDLYIVEYREVKDAAPTAEGK